MAIWDILHNEKEMARFWQAWLIAILGWVVLIALAVGAIYLNEKYLHCWNNDRRIYVEPEKAE